SGADHDGDKEERPLSRPGRAVARDHRKRPSSAREPGPRRAETDSPPPSVVPTRRSTTPAVARTAPAMIQPATAMSSIASSVTYAPLVACSVQLTAATLIAGGTIARPRPAPIAPMP